MSRIRVIILGAGGRGLNAYGEYLAKFAPDFEVVGAADPLPARLEYAKRLFPDIPSNRLVSDWRQLLDCGKIADAAIITTMEPLHAPIAIAAAGVGYHILLEKPMAPTEQACRDIVTAVKKARVIFAVCHVLRYTPFYRAIHELLAEGRIGQIVHVQHFEDVAYWHHTHSFVRGYNNNGDKTSFMLLSKSCHDIDILRYLIGRRCQRVQSFGSLMHFRRESKPREAGEAKRCHDCAYEPRCPYSTLKMYVRDRIATGNGGWMTGGLTKDQTVAGVTEALRTSPIGRCVYECDNNVVDHQIVNLEYDGGVTAGFTMSGFTEGGRRTIVQGTEGILRAELDGGRVRWLDFLTDTWHEVEASKLRGVIEEGHGGGDYGLMAEWTQALRTGDGSHIITGPDESLETHITTFAAERSRLNGTVETIAY